MSEIARQIAGLSPEQRAALRKRIAKKQAEDRRKITRRTDSESYPLSFIQERLWMLNQFEPGPLYNDYTAFRLTGPLNVTALERALGEIVRRHEVLRAIYPDVDGRPLQVITPVSSRMTLRFVDLRGSTEQEVMSRAREEARLPFDLSRGPLLRATLLRTGDDEHMLLLTMHHIVTDGWSMGVLLDEMSKLYEAYVAGEESPFAALSIQYADYAAWQREYLQGEVLDQQLAYWHEQLRGAPTLLSLPADRPRPSVQTFNGARYYFELDRELTSSLRTLSQREGATLFMTLLAAFNILLWRYTGQNDICLGTPVAGRNQPEVERLIGVFINTLVLRTQLSGDPSFRELLGRVRSMTVSAFANQELPFERLVEALQPERNLSHTPIFQVMFSFQVPGGTADNEFAGLKFSSLDADNQMSPFDLIGQLTEGADTVRGRFQYNTDLFDPSTIERMTMHFRVLLQSIVANPEQHISQLRLLTPADERQVIQEFNQHHTTYPAGGSLQEQFERQVERTPEAMALVMGGERVSYREVNERANRLAHLLRGRGAGAETLVGVLLERGVEMVVALLAVVKAGAGYVPLDPTYPAERLSLMLEDSGVKLVLSKGRLAEAVREARAGRAAEAGVEVIGLEAVAEELEGQSSANVGAVTAEENVAYVIYTSGSTGRPKGVVVTHGNVGRLLGATEQWYGFGSADVWTLFHSMAFDFSVWEMWGALLKGGRLVIVPYEVSRDPEGFYELLEREEVTVLNQTPSALRQLVEVDERRWESGGGKGLKLRAVILGGEALEMGRLQGWMERHGEQRPEIVNMYGITETTVHVSYRRIWQKDVIERANSSLIGQPLPDLDVYVLDVQGQLAPVGVPGEIYVGGGGVARGYLHRPELTAERFIPHPFSAERGARLYRTGDLARYLPEGELEYLGRIDNQVKIRGFRIELGEIEATLAEHPAVHEAVVMVRDDVSGDKRLVAYVVPSPFEIFDTNEVRGALFEKLPAYMVPTSFVILDQLPLTPSGKLDRRALPAPEHSGIESEREYVAPRTEVEESLASIWTRLLKVERVGVNDNFFELGGHSVLVTRMISEVNSIYEVDVSLRVVFETPTLSSIASEIEKAIAGNTKPAEPAIIPITRELRRVKPQAS
jgi:amino acid adenylation domain-containing protein